MKVRTLFAALGAVGLFALAAAGAGIWTSSASGVAADPPGTIRMLAHLSVGGSDFGFFPEAALSSGLAPSELELTPKGVALPGKRRPPSLTLKRGLTTNQDLSAWHEAALAGDVNGRRNVELTMYAYDGTPVTRWSLRNAWPSKYEMSSSSGDEGATETVTLVAEHVQRVSP